MITVLCHHDGQTRMQAAVDRAWLREGSGFQIWVDFAAPSPDEARVLSETFAFHELAIEDALSTMHHPKIESYEGYLYLILHGIDFRATAHHFATHDTDFFVGQHYLVTVHDGQTRSVPYVRELCLKGGHVMEEGSFALLHRIVDKMVDNYRPEVEKLADQIDQLEERVFASPDPELVRMILGLKRDIASLRRVVQPQRDVVGRLARREFPAVTETLAYRFRDIYDHLVRLTDEATYFQDRVTGLLEAYLSNTSNRLNQVMKVLTLIATVFMPLTVLTGVYGMNTELPQLPGGPAAQFWWATGMMTVTTGAMLWFFKTRNWL